jgi:hypothetical protein
MEKRATAQTSAGMRSAATDCNCGTRRALMPRRGSDACLDGAMCVFNVLCVATPPRHRLIIDSSLSSSLHHCHHCIIDSSSS